MITLQEAESALKNIYLGTMSNLLNTSSNPLFAKIEQTQTDVYGNEIRTAVRMGINGGVGAGDEDGVLPTTGSNQYLQFTSTLKNLYGQISITDKAIRAGKEGAGAFTDLLTAEITDCWKRPSSIWRACCTATERAFCATLPPLPTASWAFRAQTISSKA